MKPSQELSKWEMNEEPTSASASREQGGKKENEKPPAKMDDSHRAASDSDGEIEYGFFLFLQERLLSYP